MRKFLIAALLAVALSAWSAPIVRYVDFKVYDPVYVAIDKGFFRDAGIDVRLYGAMLAGPTAIQAVAAGKAEGGPASYPALINATASGLGVVGVADLQSSIGDQPLEEYFVRQDSPIRSIEALRPVTRFAVNLWKSSFHYTALMAMKQANVSAVDFVLVPFPQQIQALRGGSVDVVGLMEPYASELRALGGVRILFTAFDVFGPRQFSTIFLNRAWALTNPGTARRFTTTVAMTEDWIQKHETEAAAIEAKYTGVDVRYVPPYRFQPHGRVVLIDALFWLSYMEDRGDVPAGKVLVSDFATNFYNYLATQ